MSLDPSRTLKIFFVSGGIGFSLTTTLTAAHFLIFLTGAVGIYPAAGIVIQFGCTWGHFYVPIIGYLLDRIHSRLGCTLPLMRSYLSQ